MIVHKTPSAKADLVLATELLTQLISNAIKFSRECKDQQIEFGSLAEHQKTVYYLKDNGIGISMDYANQIFDPFISLDTSNNAQGNAIVLTITRQVVDLHQGNIWVESLELEGTTFFFTL